MSRAKGRNPSKTGPTSSKRAKRSLNALAIASRQVPEKPLSGHRVGHLDESTEPSRKSRDAQGQPEGARSKRRRGAGEDVEYGSDSEGNEWQLGEIDSQDDSEVDSDEAWNESDEERFEGFAFAGGSSTDAKPSKRRRLDTKDDHQESNLMEEEGEEEEEENSEDDNSWAGFENEDGEKSRKPVKTTKGALRAGKKNSNIEPLGDWDQELEGELSSESEDGSDASQEDEMESILSISDEEQEADDANRLGRLQDLIESMKPDAPESPSRGGRTVDALEANPPSDFGITSTRKLTVEDLLPSVTDADIKRSLRLLSSAQNSGPSTKSKGIPGKLEPPLAKRQQDRLDRAAAYEKSKETLERWIDTIKHHRRAEHLSFPIQHPSRAGGLPGKDVLPRVGIAAASELESTIQNILQQSGLAAQNGKTEEDHIQELEGEQMKPMSVPEAQARRAQLLMARELLFREEIRAKRLKKIKSKSFRRIHRKQREKEEEGNRAALAAGGLIDVEQEQELADRRRAEERMGARHRESRWAKSVKAGGRQQWDEDARMGIAEMAQREELLKKRIQGKPVQQGDDDNSDGSSSDGGDEDDDVDQTKEKSKLMRNLDHVESKHSDLGNSSSGPSRLSSMKFMQRAEAARKSQNDALVEEIRRDLAGEELSSDEEPHTVGRRKYQLNAATTINDQPSRRKNLNDFEEEEHDSEGAENHESTVGEPETSFRVDGQRAVSKGAPETSQHLQGRVPKKASSNASGNNVPKEKSSATTTRNKADHPANEASKSTKPTLSGPKKKTALRASTAQGDTSVWTSISLGDADAADEDEDSDGEQDHVPAASLAQDELRRRAFAGDEVDEAFEAEKNEMILDEGDKIIDETLPGWGNWVGEGISKKAQNRYQGRFQTKIEGVQKEKRADAKLANVIISEKRIKKNTKYMAPALPHPFENRHQYERSLRLPMGPEWTTKETFQAATKPRIMVKQGVIGPLENPFL
ncbi:MAG: hypothetical protein M1823_002984 [Watsoniomyces obsoletus]|nr:MAG: hypothetical protein M1823_002984 [Watsoniomyces obsoletus]